MNSLALFLALFAERFVLGDGSWRKADWLRNLSEHPLVGWLGSQQGGQLFMIVPPLLLVSLVNWLVSGWLFGIPSLVFGIGALLWCLGPVSLEPQVLAWQEAVELGEDEQAETLARQICSQGKADDQDVIADCLWPAALHRLFGPVFWFVAFGLVGAAPVGAALYWLVREQGLVSDRGQTEEDAPEHEKDCRLLAWLDWLPARLLVYSLALVGDYRGTLDRARAFRFDEHPDCTSTRVLLVLAGRGAMGCQETDDLAAAAMAIIWRAMMLWVLISLVLWLILH